MRGGFTKYFNADGTLPPYMYLWDGPVPVPVPVLVLPEDAERRLLRLCSEPRCCQVLEGKSIVLRSTQEVWRMQASVHRNYTPVLGGEVIGKQGTRRTGHPVGLGYPAYKYRPASTYLSATCRRDACVRTTTMHVHACMHTYLG